MKFVVLWVLFFNTLYCVVKRHPDAGRADGAALGPDPGLGGHAHHQGIPQANNYQPDAGEMTHGGQL